MKVLNTKSPDLPKTGGAGTMVTSFAGLAVMAGLMIAARKGKGSKAK
jgi:LPXTG-motif cell wall-anchored protein